jgi:hypothetical protein|tara:strand:+ start:735 stop:953 length:219 start_codon:yes stop_codon:yes gene_type:complete
MSPKLYGTRYSDPGSRVPTDLLPKAIRWESARAAIFKQQEDLEGLKQCLALKRVYEIRKMDEWVEETEEVLQ